MPALSPTMTTGTISKWNLAEGIPFAAGDVLCKIGTDKATMDFEAQDDGYVAKILPTWACRSAWWWRKVTTWGSSRGLWWRPKPVGVRWAVVGGTSSAPEAVGAVGLGVDASKPVRDVEDAFVLTPAARHLSQSKNVDATYLEGTGRGGRVTKGDVIIALENGVTLPH